MSTSGTLKPASTFVASRTAIVDSNGYATWSFIKILQDWDQKLTNGLNSLGQILQPIPGGTSVTGRTASLETILQNIDDTGEITSDGIDFSRTYQNQNTDYIADGSGSPLAGGKAAEIALVSSAPLPEPTKFLTGISGGIFQKAQPSFDDLAGTASGSQVPSLPDLNGQLTTGQLPAAGITATVALAKLTTLGSDGSLNITNGIITGYTAPS